LNKKKIISQLATVTLLTSTLIATAGAVNPDLVSVKGQAENGVNEEGLYLDPGKRLRDGFEISATLKPENEQTYYGHRDTVSFNLKVNKKVKAGDSIELQAYNLDGLFAYYVETKDDKIAMKNKDGVIVGHIVDDLDNDSDDVYSFHLGATTYTYPIIIFNKNAENYDTLDLHFEANNVYSHNVLTTDDSRNLYSYYGGRKVNSYIKYEYGDDRKTKELFNNSYPIKTVTLDDVKKEIENRKVVTPRVDRGISELRVVNGNASKPVINFSMKINGQHGLKKGDKVTFKTKPDSNFKFHTLNSGINPDDLDKAIIDRYNKNGTLLEGNDFELTDDPGYYLYGYYIKKSKESLQQHPSFKLIKSTPDEIVLELLDDHNYEGSLLVGFDTFFTTLDNFDSNKKLLKDLKLYVKTESQSDKTIEEYDSKVDLPVSITRADFSNNNKIKLSNQVGKNNPGEKQVGKNYITQWVVEGENEFIKPSVISSEDIEKEKAGFSPAGTIEGYEFVRTDTNTNTNTQTHVFRKIKTEPVKELKTISKDENGLVIKTEKGSGSPTDLSGYKFLEETTDKDGNKVRTYHKIVTKAVATLNGKEVVLNVKDGIVPTEKIDGYSFSERKVDPKTGDVIYLFKKDGDNSNNSSSGTNGNNGTSTANSNSGASTSGSSNETGASNSNSGTGKESSNNGTGSTNSNNGSDTSNQPLPVVMKDESGNVIKSGLDASTSKEIPGYKLIREEKDKSGNVVYTYHKIVTKLVALENGKEVVLKDKVGDLTKEEIPGYKFEKEEKSENGDTRFVYSKLSEAKDLSKKTIYKDDSGNVIKQETGVGSNETIPGYKIIGEKIDENGNKTVTYHKIVTKSKSTIDGKEVTLLVKDGLDSNPASIPGFAYSETKTDPETGDLIYYYTDRTPNIGGKLAVYKDEQGNVFLTAKGETPEVDEKLYKLLKTETDADGNQIFTYHRIVTNYTTVIDGKEDVIKTNLGETPKEEIPGYKFDKTEKDDKTGDLKQVYTKELKTADKKEAVKTGASAKANFIPIAILVGFIGLLAPKLKKRFNKNSNLK